MVLSGVVTLKVSQLVNSRRCIFSLVLRLFLLLTPAYSALGQAAQLDVIQQKDQVFFLISAEKGDEISLEKADFSLIYGLDLQIYRSDTLYSLHGQDIDFRFPDTITLAEAMVVGRSISRKQLAALFQLNQAGRYRMVATLCLSNGRCLDKVELPLEFYRSDF